MIRFLQRLTKLHQILLEGCLPNHCLLCNLPSEQSLICRYCYETMLMPRPCCLHCGCGLATTQNFCGECIKHSFEFQQLHAIAGYQSPFPELIKQLKYDNQLLNADLLGLLLADSIKQRYSAMELLTIDYVIAVPLHSKKLRKRGFNQAQLICDALIQHLPITVPCPPLITRNKFTNAQEGLTRPQRASNLNNAFSISPDSKIQLQGKYIVLIDDVVTTGATINSLCKCLLEANIKRVDVWCISRTELD
ncbi:ComF family protein [Psychromonas aquatilis]|uniref:ComF family protein n=1 Tax=Psychromonas aquatilis TaxID=2005072 RepID=A0ABU9GSA6_9GAMM